MKITKILAAFLAVACCGVFAQTAENDGAIGAPYIKLGASYRKFDDVNFKTPHFGGYSGYYLLSVGESGMVDISGLGSVGTGHSALGSVGQSGHPEYVRIVDVTGGAYRSKGECKFADDFGLAIGLGFPLSNEDGLTVDFVTNFMYFTIDTASKRPNTNGFVGSSYDSIVQNGVATPPGAWGNTYTTASGVSGNYYRAKFAMDLYQIDFGACFGYALESGLSLNLSFGPTFALAQVESSAYGSAAGTAFGGHDNKDQVVFGAYVAGGVSYWFNETVGMNFDLRYDEAFKHISTSYANLDPDSLSGILSLMIHF